MADVIDLTEEQDMTLRKRRLSAGGASKRVRKTSRCSLDVFRGDRVHAVELALARRKSAEMKLDRLRCLSDIEKIAGRQLRSGVRDRRQLILKQAFDACLIFGQLEAGSAVCIDPAGLILTCAHCWGDDASERTMRQHKTLIFSSGLLVAAKCVYLDLKMDLAILVCRAVFNPDTGVLTGPLEPGAQVFPCVSLYSESPEVGTTCVCIGQPASEDLESKTARRTGYPLIHVSRGAYQGIFDASAVDDNSEIGQLMHSCWTYWGHSGAPILTQEEGALIGLHSSWDDSTGGRRGVHVQTIKTFLDASRAHVLAAGITPSF